MDLVKKHFLSFLSAAVALIALIVAMWPMGALQADQAATLSKRASVYRELNELARRPRTEPVLDPAAKGTVALPQFPTPTIIQDARQATAALATMAKQVVATAVAINGHNRELIVPNVLPSPDLSAIVNFRSTYLSVYDDLLNNRLKGAPRVTTDDVDREAEVIWKRDFEPNIPPGANPADLQPQFEQRKALLPQQLLNKVAREHTIYADLGAFTINQSLGNPTATPDPASIWWAHVALWVQQDVVDAILQTNESATDVTNSVVKRLININVEQGFVTAKGTAGAGGSQTASADPFARRTAAKTEAVGTASITGRTSNNYYDVVHLTITADVDEENFPKFIFELGRNRFITVLNVQVDSVDSAALRSAYVYGDRPVIRLTLDCEELFMRAWTVKLMPDAVKQLLGIPLTAGGAAAGTGGPGAARPAAAAGPGAVRR